MSLLGDAARLRVRDEVVARMVATYAPLRALGERGRRLCELDTAHHLDHLEVAVALGAPALFAEYVRWCVRVLAPRKIPAAALRLNLEAVRAALGEAHSAAAAEALTAGIAACDDTGPTVQSTPPGPSEQRYLEAALRGDTRAALLEATGWVGPGSATGALLALARCQHAVGEAWLRNELPVQLEHRATAIAQVVLGQLATFTVGAPGPRPRGPALVACVEGDWHSTGPRIGADLLELAGHAVEYLGANTPTAELVRAAGALSPGLVALGVAPMTQLAQARDAIAQVRRAVPSARVVAAGFAARLAGPGALGADAVLPTDFSGPIA